MTLAKAQLAAGDANAAQSTLEDTLLRSRLEREIWLQAPAARLAFEVETALGSANAADALARADRLAHAHGARLFASPLLR